MRSRSLLAATVVLAVLSVLAVAGPAARSASRNPAPAAPTTQRSVSPTSTPTSPTATPASGGSHTVTRTERAILLVTLTFLVGAGLLGPADTEDDQRPKRPAITLYDDPAVVERAAPSRRPAGEPPPLR